MIKITNKKNKGFTLIESLVVVTMMMVITAVAVTSYATASKKNRDNRRKADLEKIRTALEMFRQSDLGGSYPAASAGAEATGLVSDNYIDAWPSDPKSSTQQYIYTRPTSYTYTVSARLEVDTGLPSSGECLTGTSGSCNYVLNNP